MDNQQPDDYYHNHLSSSPNRSTRYDEHVATTAGYYPPPPRQPSAHEPHSNAGHYVPPPPPPYPPTQSKPIIADAVNQAFDNSAAANQVPAEVIAQITEQVRSQVIDTLRKELSPATNLQPPPPSPPAPSYNVNGEHESSHGQTATRTTQEHQHVPQSGFAEPQHSHSHQQTDDSRRSRDVPGNLDKDDQGRTSRRSQDDPRLGVSNANPIHEPDIRASSRAASDAADTTASGVRFKNIREDLSQHTGDRGRRDSEFERPLPSRVRTNDEETVIEKMWQPLFQGHGHLNPTARLSQFLRGIALHLVEEYEPKHSLVVGPFKMKRLFKEMKVSDDFLPWEDIFTMRSVQLSSLYSTLMCQHHLIPKSALPHERPHLAALTPDGFASFMTLLIQAYPDIEYQRLTATLLEWPVCNADERKERWPKELSRRLLPRTSSDHHRQQLMDALRSVGIPMPHSHPAATIPVTQNIRDPARPSDPYSSSAPGSYMPPPPPSASAPPRHSRKDSFKSTQRGNDTFTSRASERDISDHGSDDSSSPSVMLERERKPYVAKEGSGKIYADSRGSQKTASSDAHATDNRSRDRRGEPHGPHNLAGSNTSTNAGHARDRGYSTSHDTYPLQKGASRTRSPPNNFHHGRSSVDNIDALRDAHTSRYKDDRFHVDDNDGFYGDRARQERYKEYDQEYRNISSNPSNQYGGNPPLGTGERRY